MTGTLPFEHRQPRPGWQNESLDSISCDLQLHVGAAATIAENVLGEITNLTIGEPLSEEMITGMIYKAKIVRASVLDVVEMLHLLEAIEEGGES